MEIYASDKQEWGMFTYAIIQEEPETLLCEESEVEKTMNSMLSFVFYKNGDGV